MNIIPCFQTNSTCYKGTTKGVPVGICWHDAASGNPWLKRWVQPANDDPDRETLLRLLGKNLNKNDWNHMPKNTGVNAVIGKLASGAVATVQSMPWDFRPWGVGQGAKGSLNGVKPNAAGEPQPFWIQFEIADDAWSNAARDYTLGKRDYCEAVYQEAVELTAYLCGLYGIDPAGTYTYKGVKVPTILCHKDAHALGFGSDHKDVDMWFAHYGLSMAKARQDVIKAVRAASTKIYRVQVGAFRNPDYAASYLQQVRRHFPDAYIKE